MKLHLDRITLTVLMLAFAFMFKYEANFWAQIVYWLVFNWWFDSTYIHVSKVPSKPKAE